MKNLSRRKNIYIASCSFGKDSIATILLALENKLPLDVVVYSEVMYDNTRGISGEFPEHREWIHNTAIPKLKQMGLEVVVVRDTVDFITNFNKIRKKGKRIGMKYGFPMVGKCDISKLKLRPIKNFLKQYKGKKIIQYIGIAADEPRRLKRLDDTHISLLNKYHYTEQMAMEKAKEYGLLSPVYNHIIRTGCWFCPNCKLSEQAYFKKNNKALWDELVLLGDTPNLCKPQFNMKQTIREIDEAINKLEQDDETLL